MLKNDKRTHTAYEPAAPPLQKKLEQKTSQIHETKAALIAPYLIIQIQEIKPALFFSLSFFKGSNIQFDRNFFFFFFQFDTFTDQLTWRRLSSVNEASPSCSHAILCYQRRRVAGD